MSKGNENISIVNEWLDEDHLMLLECWSRDGYTYQDIANRIGISVMALKKWRDKYPEITKALKNGREIIDYKVENALLKSALGYHTKEVKVTTTIRNGKTIETMKEVLDKEQAPNVSAIQCWLFNRLPDKWKKNRDNLIEMGEEDSTIQVTVTRASKNELQNDKKEAEVKKNNNDDSDEDWQEEVNKSITISKKSKEQIEKEKKEKEKAKKEEQESDKVNSKVVSEPEDDLDYWPDDWEDEE